MNYQESRAYIEQVNCYGRVLGLENIIELMRRLGNPQDDLKFIHAAGTNGKGSTLAYISTALKEAGYKVGRYTSPAIYSYREIMAVMVKTSVGRLLPDISPESPLPQKRWQAKEEHIPLPLR